MSSDRAEKKMQKVAVILGSNIHWSPYYLRYEKQLNALGQPFDLIICGFLPLCTQNDKKERIR